MTEGYDGSRAGTIVLPTDYADELRRKYSIGEPPAPHDPVNHPRHYTTHPSGIECIQVTRHMTFNIGNAIKYLWRHDQKGGVEDLRKALWYITDEINRLENRPVPTPRDTAEDIEQWR